MTECIDKQIPWFTWDAIERASEIASDEDNVSVLEWGTGGSTLFWLKHSLHLVTIEHAGDWLDRVGLALASVKPVTPLLGTGEWYPTWCPTTFNPVKGLPPATSMRAPGHFDEYVAEGYAQSKKHGQFDIVVVDGRARNQCMQVAVKIAAKWIILDNSDRADYAPGLALVKGWHAEHFPGHGPESNGVQWRTSFFRRP